MKPIDCAATIPTDSRRTPPRRRTRALRVAARLAVYAVIIVAALTIAPSVGGATVARPVQTQVSLTVVVSTPKGDAGTFETRQPIPVAVDANGGAVISGAAVTFGSLDFDLGDAAFTVELIPASDLMVAVNPATGAAAAGGQFTMLWHDHDSDAGTCSIGPFAVNATTTPFGAARYSQGSGAATMLDGAPAIPEASGCSHDGTVNSALSLPILPSGEPLPADTTPVPAIVVGASFSPPVRVPAPVVTPTTRPTPPTAPARVTPTPTSGTAPASTMTTSAPHAGLVPHAASALQRANQERNVVRRKVTTTTTPPTTVDTSLKGVRNIVPFPNVGTGGPSSADAARSRNSAIDPLPVSTKDRSMALVFAGLVVVIAAVAFALGLIGRDVRRLIPARSRHTLDGPIAPRPLPPGPNEPGDVPRPS
jgi:hypothetical protein